MLRWFHNLGIVIPEPRPIGFRWVEGKMVDLDADTVAAMTDDERDDFDVCVFTPDMPDLEDLAAGVVHIANERHERWPGPLSWRRWRLTGRVARFLYASGITSSGGTYGAGGWDPWATHSRPWRYELPRFSSVWRHRRCYVLWLPMWWWECQWRQGARLRGRHRPRPPFACAICAACLPCPSCGALYECRTGCGGDCCATGEFPGVAQAGGATVAP